MPVSSRAARLRRQHRSPITDADPRSAAAVAGLRFISDDVPGIRRRRAGTGFHYTNPDGTPLRDAAELRRIRALAIPPAWTDVWIAPLSGGHLQATGRDARGRKQYRYHPRWREVRNATKYDRMLAFGEVLPALRERVAADLALPGLPRPKVVAAVVRLLESTLIRVGNEEYARNNGSFGLTTMRSRHVDVTGSRVRFRFRGKSGVRHSIDVSDQRLARIVRRCQELPGAELFQYEDADGEYRSIDSGDVNDYLRHVTGDDFTAKDFRTWAGTVLAAEILGAAPPVETEAQAKQAIVEAMQVVAGRLGNSPAVCRACYVHPAVLDSFLAGRLPETIGSAPGPGQTTALSPSETALLALLRSHAA